MSRISRVAVLVTALASLFAVLSSTAGATTFTNSGGTSFHATGGSGVFTITSTTGSGNINCSNSTATGVVAAGTYAAMHGSLTFQNCPGIGLELHMSCGYTQTPITFTGGTPGVTDGVADMHCVLSLRTTPFTAICTITGQTASAYTNPSGPTPGRVTLANSGTLVISSPGATNNCAALGAPAGEPRPVDLSEQTLTLTSVAESPISISP